jgi:hypothetical protein
LRRPPSAPPLPFARGEAFAGLGLDFTPEELRVERALLCALPRLPDAFVPEPGFVLDFCFAPPPLVAPPLPPAERAAPPDERDEVLLLCVDELRELLEVDRLLREVARLPLDADRLALAVERLLPPAVDLARARGERERGFSSL